LIYADGVSILGGSTHTVYKNTEALTADSKQTAVAVNAEEAKLMVMSCDQQAEQNVNKRTVHKSPERVD
jgi:hypothetical protein